MPLDRMIRVQGPYIIIIIIIIGTTGAFSWNPNKMFPESVEQLPRQYFSPVGLYIVWMNISLDELTPDLCIEIHNLLELSK